MIDSIDEPPAPPSMKGILAVQSASRDGAAVSDPSALFSTTLIHQ